MSSKTFLIKKHDIDRTRRNANLYIKKKRRKMTNEFDVDNIHISACSV